MALPIGHKRNGFSFLLNLYTEVVLEGIQFAAGEKYQILLKDLARYNLCSNSIGIYGLLGIQPPQGDEEGGLCIIRRLLNIPMKTCVLAIAIPTYFCLLSRWGLLFFSQIVTIISSTFSTFLFFLLLLILKVSRLFWSIINWVGIKITFVYRPKKWKNALYYKDVF